MLRNQPLFPQVAAPQVVVPRVLLPHVPMPRPVGIQAPILQLPQPMNPGMIQIPRAHVPTIPIPQVPRPVAMQAPQAPLPQIPRPVIPVPQRIPSPQAPRQAIPVPQRIPSPQAPIPQRIPSPIPVPRRIPPPPRKPVPPVPFRVAPPSPEPELRPQQLPQMQPDRQLCDPIAYDIFATVDRKYRVGDRIFDAERDRILDFFLKLRVTRKGFANLIQIVDLYEGVYEKFVSNVRDRRIFFEKSGFGKPARQIRDPQDWAEAIIELIDLVSSYRRDIATAVSNNLNPETVRAECQSTEVDNCQPPCEIKRPLFSKNYCDIK